MDDELKELFAKGIITPMPDDPNDDYPEGDHHADVIYTIGVKQEICLVTILNYPADWLQECIDETFSEYEGEVDLPGLYYSKLTMGTSRDYFGEYDSWLEFSNTKCLISEIGINRIAGVINWVFKVRDRILRALSYCPFNMT